MATSSMLDGVEGLAAGGVGDLALRTSSPLSLLGLTLVVMA